MKAIIAALRTRYGAPKAHLAGRDPFAHIVAESVAYLASDAVRKKALTSLRSMVGRTPAAIAAAPLVDLTAICRSGGSIAPMLRARRLKEIATIVLDEYRGSLRQVLKWDYLRARRALQRFPSIGEPGADRILMLCGSHAVLGLDSNALRVLTRLGYARERKNYTATYRDARAAAAKELPRSAAALGEASTLLRAHGLETCRRSVPRCEECVLTAHCAWYRARH